MLLNLSLLYLSVIEMKCILAAVSQHHQPDGRMKVIELLLAHGSNLESKTNKGVTPLMKAAMDGHDDLAELFLKHDAEVNAATFDGYTAVMLASQVDTYNHTYMHVYYFTLFLVGTSIECRVQYIIFSRIDRKLLLLIILIFYR